MSPTRRLLLASALALAGCSRLSGDAGPQVRALVPTGGYVGTATDLRVLGTGFTLRGIQQISGGPSVASTFTVAIGGRAFTATPQAIWNGLQVLQVTVPADLPAGVYDVAVQDPYGAWGTLPRAFSMSMGPPSQLSAQLTAPASGNVGDTLTVSFTVSDTGGVAASAVTPTLALGGGAAPATATVASGPAPGSASIPAGGSQTFTWAVTLATPGTLQLAATANGRDANSGSAISAGASASVAVSPDAMLLTASDPFNNDGTGFASIFSYQGLVYLGPDYKSQSTLLTAAPANTQSGAVSMAPNGTSQKAVPWQLEVNLGARNLAYQGGVLCHTIGFSGCSKDTPQCGPNNEAGRALFASGVIGGTEWYMVSGASPNLGGGSNYLYMTNPTFPLASGGYDDLAYVQIGAALAGSTRQMTSAHVFQNALYMGFLDLSGTSGGNAPVLAVLNRMPALPGYVANGGTDVVNLNGAYLPAVGISGSPANPGAPSGQLQIDSIADFNGSLYVANNGGIARSVGPVAPCAAAGCANWANATPSAAAWAGQTSVTTVPGDIGALQLARRGVPWVVPFGGRLFAARNTTNGPQLWSCLPTGPSGAQQCRPADWSLVAANTKPGLNAQLTQMNDGNNGAATLLAATSSHLYVGFDDGNGVQIYRTANAAAAQISDFAGRAGCIAGTAGCQGIGGNGLGTPAMTQFYDAHAFTYSGNEWVYVSAGAGSGGPRVFRLAP